MSPIIINHDGIEIQLVSKNTNQKTKESLLGKIWRVVKNVLISTVLFLYVSQSFFTAGIFFGAVFYQENQLFAHNLSAWWEMAGVVKRVFAVLFGVMTFPFLAKIYTLLWAANLASSEICSAVGEKYSRMMTAKGGGGNARTRLAGAVC